MSRITGSNTRAINLFMGSNPPMDKIYGDEIHLFMHAHMRGYDRTGEGIEMDASFFDKYGAPIHLHDFWMEGYHAIERMLADHYVACDNPYIKFPPVAGYAGGTHLYKVGTEHAKRPWNWTGWIPRWTQHVVVDAMNPKGRQMANRFFMAFRGNEIQNDYWDYHPCHDEESDLNPDDVEEVEESPKGINNDKYRGGYFYEGNSWGRYLHINTLKSHVRDTSVSPAAFKRYNYIVHPLAYRIATNKKPDNSVDGIQWCVMNIVNEPHFGNPMEWGEKCNGIELFNDFTYFHSYNTERTYHPVERQDFRINCCNGEHHDGNIVGDDDNNGYIWWFDTYPLEYAEFLLETALSRGVFLHPLASNDASYNRQTPLAEYQAQFAGGERLHRDTEGNDALRADPKGINVQRMDAKTLEQLNLVQQPDGTYKRKAVKSKNKENRNKDDQEEERLAAASKFIEMLPYKEDTAFGYTTLIDPKLELKKMVVGIAGDDGILGTNDDVGSLDDAEFHAIDYLVDGRHFSHLGVYGLFNYHAYDEKFPIEVQGQEEKNMPCYDMTEDMDLIFTFMPCKKESCSSFTDTPKDFVWKYAMQLNVDEDQEETIHGYFNLDEENKTRLDLSNYDKMKMRWIRFTCFEPASPQQRAWFIPIKGVAFGKPRNLVPRKKGVEEYVDTPPKMRHQIAIVEETEVVEEEIEVDDEDKEEGGDTMTVSVRIMKQAEDYFNGVYSVEAKELKFLFDKCSDEEEDNMYAYHLQVCPNQQDLELLKSEIPDIEEVNDPVLPPRIRQSVHGYLELNNKYPTRLDLSNQWDPETVRTKTVDADGEEVELGKFVHFYAIDTKTFQPIEVNPKPCPIEPEYETDPHFISNVTKLEDFAFASGTLE